MSSSGMMPPPKTAMSEASRRLAVSEYEASKVVPRYEAFYARILEEPPAILPAHLAWFREDLWNTLARDPNQADWIVVNVSTTSTCRIPADAKKVFEVDVAGAPLAQVYQRSEQRP